MHCKLVSKPSETRVWIAVLERGEEAKSVLVTLAKREGIENASFMALGAFEKAVIAYFDWEKKKYLKIPIDEQVEVIALAGDIVPDDKGMASLHAHVVLGRRDGTTRGGHLVEGHVRPTLEVTVTELPAHLRRHKHPDLGVALIEPA
jgi:predicted DNA-binding protein with PD1-like motif